MNTPRTKEPPPSRRRPGWKQEFLESVRDAAHEMEELSLEGVTRVVARSRRAHSRGAASVAKAVPR